MATTFGSASINSEFGTFTISKNDTTISVTGPDSFSASFTVRNWPAYNANNEVIGTSVDSFEYAIAYQNATLAATAKIKELSDKRAHTDAVNIDTKLNNIHSKLNEILVNQVAMHGTQVLQHATQVVMSKDLQNFTDRASNENYGIITKGSENTDIYRLDRAATVNALRKAGELDNVKAEMNSPTPLPHDDIHYGSNDNGTLSSGGSPNTYET